MTILNNNFGLLGLPNLGVTGINPNAQMPNTRLQQQLPSGGMGGQPTILNQMPNMGLMQPVGGYGQPTVQMPIPTMQLPQPQQPTTFAQRLGNIGQRLMDFGIGRNMAGKASLDPSSGDAGFVDAMGFQNMQNQARARSDLANTLRQQQIANQVSFMNQMTNAQKNFAYRDNLPDDKKADFDSFIKSSGFSNVPSAIQKYQQLQNIRKVHGENSQQEKDFMNVIRGTSTVNIGGEVFQIDGFGNIINKIDKTLPPTDQPENVIKKEESKVKGKELGELKIQYPKIQSEMKQKVSVIDDILTDPNLDDYLGGNALLPAYPGSAKSDFRAKLKMLKSQEFLTQFDKLRGGGQISNAEGDRAVSAGTIISDELSKQELVAELKRLREVALNVSERKFKQIESLSGNQSQTAPSNEIIEVKEEEL